ncbi:hypothetical protein KIPB_007550, partial [Kipferlia bialata]
GGSFAPLLSLFVSVSALTVSMHRVVSSLVSIRQLVETVAAKALVSRVSAGRYFSRMLSPLIAEGSGLFDLRSSWTESEAKAFTDRVRQRPVPAGVDATLILSLLNDQIVALCKCESEDLAPSPDTTHFLNSVYASLHHEAPAPESVSPSTVGESTFKAREVFSLFERWYPTCIDRKRGTLAMRGGSSLDAMSNSFSRWNRDVSETESSAPGATDTFRVQGMRGRLNMVSASPIDTIDTYTGGETQAEGSLEGVDIETLTHVSDREARLMRQAEIEFLPLAVYVKLDIVGFTSLCHTGSSVETVELLKTLFECLDAVVLSHSAIGAIKVKTVGDAYEVMRPYRAQDLARASVASIVSDLRGMCRLCLDCVRTCKDTFAAAGQPKLSVRVGMAMGPAFACCLGTVRVSYNIFGMAPARARQMEQVSPVGQVTVSRPIYNQVRQGERQSTDRAQSRGSGASRTSRTSGRFIFGDVVRRSDKTDAEAAQFLERSQALLHHSYTPREGTDCAPEAYEAAQAGLATLVHAYTAQGERMAEASPPTHDRSLVMLHLPEGKHERVEGVVLVGVT